MNKHGVAVREIKSKRLVNFIECECGRQALRVLGRVRINLDSERYRASEEMVSPEEIAAVER